MTLHAPQMLLTDVTEQGGLWICPCYVAGQTAIYPSVLLLGIPDDQRTVRDHPVPETRTSSMYHQSRETLRVFNKEEYRLTAYLLEPVMNMSLCVHTTVGFGYPLAVHLRRTSSPVLKVWFCGFTVTTGRAGDRHERNQIWVIYTPNIMHMYNSTSIIWAAFYSPWMA